MVMDMPLVNVGGQYKFILAAQDLFCKLHPDLMGFLRGDLPRGEGLYQVAPQIVPFVDGMAACPSKFNIGCISIATIGGYQQFPIRFGWIANIRYGSF